MNLSYFLSILNLKLEKMEDAQFKLRKPPKCTVALTN